MATLLEVLGEELGTQVQQKIDAYNGNIQDKSKHARFTDLSEGKFVSVEKYNAEHTKLSETESLLTAANQEIKSYKDMDIDGIKAKAGEWETKYNADMAAMQQKLETQDKKYAAEKFISTQGLRSKMAQEAAVGRLMDLDYKDGSFVGAKELMEKLKAEDPDSFAPEEPENKTKGPQSWVRPTGRNVQKPITQSEEKAYLDSKYKDNPFYGK